MKPTYRNRAGNKACTFKIEQRIDVDDIEVAVMCLLDHKEPRITRGKVEEKLRSILQYKGSEFFECTGDADRWIHDVDELTKQAAEKSKELFPEFY